jgi:uncharacterized protein YbjT (DUF2867 family)
MKVLVLADTCLFGIHMVNSLLNKGHNATIAARGKTRDMFEGKLRQLLLRN